MFVFANADVNLDMSWSLQLRGGDLVINGAKLGQVTGSAKLVQDLRCALLEHQGNDDMHPSYGSLIDGGMDDNGREVESLLGGMNWELIALRVESEIRRIAQTHQQGQLQRAKQDRYTYGDSTLNPTELLLNVSQVEMFHTQDTLLVRVHISTGSGQDVVLDLPVSNSGALTV